MEREDDYYWVYDTTEGIVHSSCCIGWTSHKGILPDNDYDKLVGLWNMNNTTHAI